MERKTIAQWIHYLETPDAQLTLTEFMALCLVHIREHVKDSRYATEHLEGMTGSIDEYFAFMAQTQNIPYGENRKENGKLKVLPTPERLG